MLITKRRVKIRDHDLPFKANRILHIILIALSLLIIRIWYLAVVEYDQRLAAASRPQQKSVIEPAIRATIRDRFNIPLAINKTSYQATILYSELKDVPSFVWQTDSSGKRIKIFKRREYIRQLSQLLGQELDLDPERIEDLIHSKASFYAQVPFVIKEEISEQEYYRLKMLSREWPGIHMRSMPKRNYPQGRTGADIIGYMGAINRQEYEKILREMKALEKFIKDRENGEEGELPYGIQDEVQALNRLKDLKEKAYTINDYVGKTGIEGVFEEKLRGFYGKINYYTDSKGNLLWELPGSKPPLAGQRVLLTISSELQEYAEQLLAENEEFRLVRKSNLGAVKKTVVAQKAPWIKGGAIVVLEPYTGEVLALASYPRFDPNDFISSGNPENQKSKAARINRWFENENYWGQLWDLQQPFERERFDPLRGTFLEERRWLNWSNYLDFALLPHSQVRMAMDRIETIEQAVRIQKYTETLLSLFPGNDIYSIFNLLYQNEEHIPYSPASLKNYNKLQLMENWQTHTRQALSIKTQLDVYFSDLPNNYDKVLTIDLCRLVVNGKAFDDHLLQKTGQNRLENYRQEEGALVSILSVVRELSKGLFHDNDFKDWRKQEEKNFLKQKRLEEKAAKVYAKPYLDYFDQFENQLFQSFWDKNKWFLLGAFLMGEDYLPPQTSLIDEQLEPYISYFSGWNNEIKNGAHQAVEWKNSYIILQKSIQPLPRDIAIDYLQTMRSYQDLNRPLLGRYKGLRHQNAPTEKDLAAVFYPVYGYGYGRSHAYRQATIQGSLFKIVTAYEALVQRYKKLEGKVYTLSDLNPLIISDQEFMSGQNRFMGYTEEGRPIPQLYKGGRLPRSLAHRNTGRVDLVRAFEVSSNPYFSMLASDCLENPQDLTRAADQFGFGNRTGIHLPGEIPGKIPNDVDKNRTGLYALAIGQHSLVVTPLQTAVMLAAIANHGKIMRPKIVSLTAGKQPVHSGSTPSSRNCIYKFPTEVTRELFMPEIVRQIILKGLHATVQRTCQESLSSLEKLYKGHPEAIQQLKLLKNQLLGKTSTSESVEKIDLDLEEGTNIYTHVWFGSISCDKEETDLNKSAFILKDEFGRPELIVVVYLRFGGYGKEAAPLAAQIVKKWREIKQKHDNLADH